MWPFSRVTPEPAPVPEPRPEYPAPKGALIVKRRDAGGNLRSERIECDTYEINHGALTLHRTTYRWQAARAVAGVVIPACWEPITTGGLLKAYAPGEWVQVARGDPE